MMNSIRVDKSVLESLRRHVTGAYNFAETDPTLARKMAREALRDMYRLTAEPEVPPVEVSRRELRMKLESYLHD